ncbi:MAG: sensor histidine kinase [Herminiimonas sp.]|nr:sensor histidine kinase [Herminiimonas sp.]
MNARFSLRRQLVTRLLWPVLVLVAVAGILAYSIGLHFANLAYDRWMYDSARALAHQVRWIDGSPKVTLPQAAIEMFEWDDIDRIYYAVTGAAGEPIYGFDGLPELPAALRSGMSPAYYDGMIDGRTVRIVVLRLPAPGGAEAVTVRVAETSAKRNILAKEILLEVLVYQALLAGAASLLIWAGIRSGLQPLAKLAEEIMARTPADLGPLLADVPQEVRPLVHSLNDLLTRLEATQAAQKRFIADASHQLRTPLSALQIQAERASRENDPDARAEALRRVNASITRITHVTHQLLTLARADPASEARQRFAPIDLARVAREVTTEWVPIALTRGVDLGYTGPETGAPVFGEAQMLKELLGNLIDNALQYNYDGGRVTVGVAAAPAAILFVEDDGPGIPPEAREKVFERFFRLPGSGGRGCGLGLAIVKEISQLHDAVVLAEPGDGGHGTRVKITFKSAPAQSFS